MNYFTEEEAEAKQGKRIRVTHSYRNAEKDMEGTIIDRFLVADRGYILLAEFKLFSKKKTFIKILLNKLQYVNLVEEIPARPRVRNGIWDWLIR